MSNRLRLVVAVLTLTLVFGASIAFEQMLADKTVEGTETHIHLAEHKMRTCGVETLRSSGKEVAITDDGMGGLIVSFSGTTHMTLHVVAISEDRMSLSEVLCVRHSMSTRSMNATQDEDNRSSGQGGAATILSRSA